MGWREDLADLLAGGQNENLPFDELGRGDWWGAATAPVSAAFNIMDLPLSGVKEGIGQAQNVFQGEGLQGVGAGRQQWEQDIQGLNEADLGMLGFAKSPLMVALELGLDPTTYFGVGIAKKLAGLAKGVAAAPEVGRGTSLALGGLARGIEGANFVYNTVPEKAIGVPLRYGGRAVKGGIEKVFPTAFEYAPKDQIRRRVSDVGGARNSQQTARKQQIPGANLPATIPWQHPGKSLAPIDQYDVPPFFETGIGTGVNGAIKQRAWDSYQRMKAEFASFPDIPGVTIPVTTPPQPGEATFAAAQRPGSFRDPARSGLTPSDPNVPWGMGPARDFGQPVPYGKKGSQTWVDKLRQQSLGIVAGRRDTTRFEDMTQLGGLTEQHLQDMANIAAAVMLDYDNDVANKMFAPLMRAAEGFPKAKRELVQQFGAGIEPAIPAMYDSFRKILAEHPDRPIDVGRDGARFFLQWGFPEGEVPFRSLAEMQARVDAGDMTEEDAFSAMAGYAFNKHKPEIVETVAAMGSGFLRSVGEIPGDVSPNRGPFASPGMQQFPENVGLHPSVGRQAQRAIVPDEFASQFQRNRDAYDQYVTQLFGKFRPEELETLRKMSIEALYDEAANAAGVYSGGASGATALLERGEGVGRRGEAYTKLGSYPGGEGTVAARRGQMPEMGISGGAHGRPTIRALNRNLADEQGVRYNKNDSNAVIARKLTEAGHVPWEANPKGGPLASLRMILDHYAVGKDLPAGEGIAADYYDRAVDEIMTIVGPGNYEDAMVLIELVSATSTGTDVARNMDNAIRAWAEWKLGSSAFIQNDLNLTPEDVDRILNKGGRWTGTFPATRGLIEGDPLFMKAMAGNQKKTAGKILETYIERRIAADPSWTPVQGGPKTNGYAGSFVVKVWQDAIDHYLPVGPLQSKVRRALDEAEKAFALDRHIGREDNLATAITPMGGIAGTELRLIAAKQLGISPGDLQSGGWYWSKNQQGFFRTDRNDDVALQLRQAWNQKHDPARVAAIREKIKAEHPGISEEELSITAQDWMRQEFVMGYIKDALKGDEKRITKLLGGDHPLFSILNAGNDVLGIVNRASKGVVPRAPISRSITKLGSQARDLLGQVARGESPGVLLRTAADGRSFTPDTPAQGFLVNLATTGPVSSAKQKTASKTIDQFLGTYADLLDDPALGENIRFGIVPNGPEGTHFTLAVVAPSEEVATALAREIRQPVIVDLLQGSPLRVDVTGPQRNLAPGQIRETVRGLFDLDRPRKPTLDEVKQRGVTLEELDSVNPISILQRKVVQPIMERIQTLSESGRQAIAAQTPLSPRQGVLVGQPSPTEPFDFASIDSFYQDPSNRLLSTQEAKILGERDPTGRTLSDQLDEWNTEATQDIASLDQAGVMWDPNLEYEERLKLIADRPDLQKIVKKYHDIGLDIRFANPSSVEMRHLERAEAKRMGIDLEKRSTFDLLRAAWGEMALFSPKYHTGNIQGSWFANALGGVFAHQGPDQVLAAFKLVRGGLDGVTRQEAMNSLHAGQIVQKWGDEELPSFVSRGGVRDMASVGRTRSGTATGELVTRLTRSKKAGHLVSKPLIASADSGQAIDIVGRGAIYTDTLDREMTNAMQLIEDDIRVMADKQGLQNFEFSQNDLINPVPRGISAKRLKQHLMSMGFKEGYAERAGRNYSEAHAIAKRLGREEMEKRQFSYDRTNLDEFVGKFVPFHYYMSRAARYYGEETLRNPYLFLNYMRYNDGIEDAQTDPGLSGRQKGFLQLMQTPLGFTLLMNPDAMFGVVKLFDLDTTYEADGQTSAGGVVSWLKNRGLGLYPWIDGTLNLMGMYGDTYEPDLLGIRHKALIGSVVNFMRSQLGMDPGRAPYAEAMGQARWNVSNFVNGFTPDWLFQPVLPKAGGSSQDATIDTVIESRIIAANPGITNQDLLDIMTDPDSPPYQQAYQEAAAAGIVQQLLNFTLPVNTRMREASRDVRAAQTSTIYEAAEKAGVSPTEFKPSMGDAEFGARYKNLTGKDWQPGDYARAKAEQDLSKATPQAKPFVLQENEYKSLGTDEQRRIYDKYQDIAFGNRPETAGMDSAAARMLADTWANRMGYTTTISEVQQLRTNYELTHTEFGQFKGWQDQMRNLSTHLGGTLSEYRRQAAQQNPNAQRYFTKMIEDVHQQTPQDQWADEIEQRTMNADAYQAITGKTQARFDPAPVPGVAPFDVTLPDMAFAQGPPGYDPNWEWMNVLSRNPGGLINFR